MRKKMMVSGGIIIVLFLAAAVGCKKKDAAVLSKDSAVQGQKPPAHEQIPTVRFSPAAPTNLPNVTAYPGGAGKVEWVNDAPAAAKTKVSKKDKLSLIGWVANDVAGTVPPTVIVQLNSTAGNAAFYAPATRTKQKRPDIAKAQNKPALENSAFQLDADLSGVPQGTYMISFLLSDGKYIIGFDSNTAIEIQ